MENWRYPRTELAERYLGLLAVGISSHFAIIAPRRKGKTLFVLQDLAPRAAAKGYLPVYASLWQDVNNPHEGLLAALEEAIGTLNDKSALNRLLNAKIRKVAAGNELLGKVEVEFADRPQRPASQELVRMDRLLHSLERKAKGKTVLLLIDEVQHLATSERFAALAHALRTMLDKRQGQVKSFFTGSSRHYMNLLFDHPQSSFYRFAEAVPFPDLDDKFISFLHGKLTKEHQLEAQEKALKAAFSDLDHSPYWMMRLVSHMIVSRGTVAAALAAVRRLLAAAEGFEELAGTMPPVDQLVFLSLCDGASPFAKDTMAKIGRAAHVKGTPANIQRAIERLAKAHLISQSQRGQYHIEKPGLRRYLEEHADWGAA